MIGDKTESTQPQQTMPLDSAARKNTPLCTGVLDYFPAALAAVAYLSKLGNDKHNPGEPLHWARGKSMDHADCILRHLADRGVIDPETGLSHTVEIAWRALALLQVELEQTHSMPLPRGASSPPIEIKIAPAYGAGAPPVHVFNTDWGVATLLESGYYDATSPRLFLWKQRRAECDVYFVSSSGENQWRCTDCRTDEIFPYYNTLDRVFEGIKAGTERGNGNRLICTTPNCTGTVTRHG